MNIWKRLMLEFEGGWTAAGGRLWAGTGDMGYSRKNFDRTESDEEWPYDDSVGGGPFNATDQYTAPSGHQRSRGRPNVSGQNQPSSTYIRTWQSEAMGSPSKIGPFVPFDGPSGHSARDAGPVRDEDGRPIDDGLHGTVVDSKIGPNNMWGGAGMIPGSDRGWAASPKMGDDPDDIWVIPEDDDMNQLREFFDPRPIAAEEVENPGQDNLKDQSDEEIENRIDGIYGQEDNHEFDDGKEPDDDSFKMGSDDGSDEVGDDTEAAGIIMIDDEPAGILGMGSSSDPETDDELPGPPPAGEEPADFQLTVKPEAGVMPTLAQFLEPQDYLVGGAPGTLGMPAPGNARGLYGMIPDAKGLVPKGRSAWDEIALQVGDAVINLRKNGQ